MKQSHCLLKSRLKVTSTGCMRRVYVAVVEITGVSFFLKKISDVNVFVAAVIIKDEHN